MIVCIAEKPSVARDIAQVLGATSSRDGYMEGNGYQVTWTFGHLCTLKEPEEYSPNWKYWSLGALPMIPQRFGIKLIKDTGIEKQFRIIEGLMQNADKIINCGDAGQEGELIQRWVMQKAGAKCPVERLWISSLTEEAIREGFKSLKDQSEYQSLYEAGLSRAIGDWTLGMNATRLYTLKYGQNRQVLSIGRVQTPTLALIVARQHEIDNFVSRPYWVLTTVYRDTTFSAIIRRSDEEMAEENAKRAEKNQSPLTDADNPGIDPISSMDEGRSIMERIAQKEFVVDKVTKKDGKELPPRLFDLTSLQVECNRKFGYSADQTLQLIQSLYEKKFATYPRVDTTYLSDDIYPKCPKILQGLTAYEPLLQKLGGKALRKDKKVFDSSKVTDHHAIIPTGVPVQNLTDMERNVYDLIARRFIGVFYPDCKFSSTTVLGHADDVPFKATGRQIVEQGWREVWSVSKASDAADDEESAEQEGVLPDFRKGEQGPHVPDLAEKMTQPPKYYTEATLLRAMETAGKFVDSEELRDALKENGIGRPSTRAAIIETLFKRHYIRKERKNLLATPTGIELISLIREDLLKSAELTGIWENKLRQIEKHNYSARTFIDELKAMVRDVVNSVLADNSNRRVTVTTDETLKEAIAKKKASQKKDAAPRKRKTAAKNTEPVASDTEKKSAPHYKVGDVCPLCGKGHIIKGNTAFGCSEWKSGCKFRAPLTD